MIKMSNKNKNKIGKKITELEYERENILSQLKNSPQMMRGSYACVYTKCGKKNCHCMKDKGHPHSRISWSKNGKSHTRKIPVKEINRVCELTDNYRNFKKLRKSLADLFAEENHLLDQLEKKLIDNEYTRT